jgi:FSR family fosmidomycin resistance protein-like MFS transporter
LEDLDLAATTQTGTLVEIGQKVFYKVLIAISICHLLNDMMSSLLPAIYPLLKTSFNLNFAQVA